MLDSKSDGENSYQQEHAPKLFHVDYPQARKTHRSHDKHFANNVSVDDTREEKRETGLAYHQRRTTIILEVVQRAHSGP